MASRRGRVLAAVMTAVGVTAAGVACEQSPRALEPTTINGTTTGSAATTTTPTTPTTSAPAPRDFPYQPLWPFADADAAAAWQESYRSGGHQPWHLDAEATTIAFTTDHLGFTEIDQVLASDVRDDEAWVTVGYAVEQSKPGTAAVVHLARIGAGQNAPWEVVGTRDTTLTLTQPRYGTTVSSPVTVGGQVTGVDESIRVQVIGPSGGLGDSCCLAAGGEDTPWSTTVTYQGATGDALTIVASTGGHVTEVERFAITGVRPAA
ncbi:hypothetical protein [Actinophytocola glycyrrhizae]|uniref:Uncharacterized protein n=1 Tax=Actinophytocola glycyrrhizae TaxID=2044873 RepID=A0ABV9SAE7_9PSEU